MTALSIQPTYPIFTDIDGQPLDSGYVYIGQANLDPQVNPINVYWDAALTQLAVQPIRTLNGYPSNSGTPARLYVGSDYSIRVMNKKASTVYNAPEATERYSSAIISQIDSSLVGYTPAGTGAVATTAQSKLRETISLKDFGAVGDGVTDDTAAIQAAFNYAASIGACVVDKTGKNYKITSMVTILCSCDLSNATFLVPAASVPIAVRVGSTTADVFTLSLKMPKLLNISKTTLGWTGFQTAVGFDFANLYSSNIYIPDVRKFGVGVDVGGYGKGGLDAGNAYNTYEIGLLYDNFINLRLRSKGTGGFANQNTFVGGNYSGTGAEGPATGISGSYGIELNGANNNTFLNPSIEAIWNEYQIQLKNCSFNTFISQRLENTVPGRINFHADTVGQNQSNLFMNGYAFDVYNVSKTGAGTSLYNKFIGNKYSDAIQYGGVGLVVNNLVSDGASTPHITGYTATVDPATKLALGATDWSYKIYSEGYTGKRSTDAEANFRVKLDLLSGRIYVGDGTGAPNWYLSGFSSSSLAAINNAAAIIPIPDNTTSLGLGSYRWSVVYAATGTINTSDERTKQDISDLDAAEKRVAVALKGLVKKFRFKDAVQAKGDGARIHVGVIAQEVIAAFKAEGLDPMRYALVCYDEWEAEPEEVDDDGKTLKPAREAGDRYGIRYEELLAFIIAAL